MTTEARHEEGCMAVYGVGGCMCGALRKDTERSDAAEKLSMDPQRVAFEQSRRDRWPSARCFFETLAALYSDGPLPKTMLDVGCGDGHLVKIAAAIGVDFVLGIDANIHDNYSDGGGPTPWRPSGYEFRRFDLAISPFEEYWWLRANSPFDLVLCWEVAEHLPPSAADTLCDTLAAAVAPGGWLVFTAAQPGQGGSGHLNEQPKGYWAEKLCARGLTVHGWHTEQLMDAFARVAPTCPWYHKNCLVFDRVAP